MVVKVLKSHLHMKHHHTMITWILFKALQQLIPHPLQNVCAYNKQSLNHGF